MVVKAAATSTLIKPPREDTTTKVVQIAYIKMTPLLKQTSNTQ